MVEKNKNLEKLEKVIDTYNMVSDAKNVSGAFENAKKRLILEFESAKDEIEKLSKGDISIKVETQYDGIKIEVLEISKLEKSEKTEYTISFENDKREIYLKVTEFEERFRGSTDFIQSSKSKAIPDKTFKQGYGSKNNEFCFTEGKEKVDVFESVINYITSDLLNKSKVKNNFNVV